MVVSLRVDVNAAEVSPRTVNKFFSRDLAINSLVVFFHTFPWFSLQESLTQDSLLVYYTIAIVYILPSTVFLSKQI